MNNRWKEFINTALDYESWGGIDDIPFHNERNWIIEETCK